jgi:hypothetical protein
MTGMTPELAARIIAGAHKGRLLLTLDEVQTMLDEVPGSACVITDRGPVLVCDVPVTNIDAYDPFTEEEDRWLRNIVGSFADGLIDADDVERLWPRPSS